MVFNICKSSSDEYLNSDCIIPKLQAATDDAPASYKITANSSQIKAQEIDLNYPCLVSNIGINRIMIQSLTNPTQVNSFRLDEQDLEFLCFVDY